MGERGGMLGLGHLLLRQKLCEKVDNGARCRSGGGSRCCWRTCRRRPKPSPAGHWAPWSSVTVPVAAVVLMLLRTSPGHLLSWSPGFETRTTLSPSLCMLQHRQQVVFAAELSGKLSAPAGTISPHSR